MAQPGRHSSRSASVKHEAITIAALGRPFQLGMLYDCRNDTLVTGLSLWDQDTIKNYTHKQRMETSTVHLITGDDTNKKALSMGVNGEAQLSIMSGALNVKGSAEFLMDTASSKKQTRVSLHYQSISEFKEMDVQFQKQERWDIIKLNVATHVVTGILYGADAVFVFDHTTEDETTKMKVQADMEAAIKKISGNLKGGGEMTHEQQATSNKLSCKFYGDVILDKLPTTFSEARDAYDIVIEKINIGGVGDKKAKERERKAKEEERKAKEEKKIQEGEKKEEEKDGQEESIDIGKEEELMEKTVPKMVWMIPLDALDINAPTVVRKIDDVTVSRVQSTINQLKQLKVTATDLKKTYSFPPFSDYIQHQLDTFLSLVDARLMKLMTELKDLLPQLRGDRDTKHLTDLTNLLHESMEAPFDFLTLSNWLAAKETEASTLKSLFLQVYPNEGKNEGIEIAGTIGQFNSVLISHDWEYVLVVAFSNPIAGSIDPLSKAMEDYLIDPERVKDWQKSDGEKESEKKIWHNNPSKVLGQKTIVQSFANFAEVNKENKKVKFAVTCTFGDGYRSEDGPASIKLYTPSGNVAIDPESKIEIPGKPCNLKIDGAVLTWQKPEKGGDSVTSYTITLKHDASREETFKHDADKKLELTLPGLKKQRNSYVVTIQANGLKLKIGKDEYKSYDVGLSDKSEKKFEFQPEDMPLEEHHE